MSATMHAMIKKISNQREFREFMEALYNNASECSPNISELGQAGFLAAVCAPEVVGMDNAKAIARIADENDGYSGYVSNAKVWEATGHLPFPLYVSIAPNSGHDVDNWFAEGGISLYTEKMVQLGNDPSWELGDFFEECVL